MDLSTNKSFLALILVFKFFYLSTARSRLVTLLSAICLKFLSTKRKKIIYCSILKCFKRIRFPESCGINFRVACFCEFRFYTQKLILQNDSTFFIPPVIKLIS